LALTALPSFISTSKFDEAGIYKLMCRDYNKVYIGQTGRTLRTRYKEHIRSIKYNNEDSRYITHILNNTHNYGIIEDVMEKIDQAEKGRIMKIKENLHIYIYKNKTSSLRSKR
jgi:ACT domain-containing protein